MSQQYKPASGGRQPDNLELVPKISTGNDSEPRCVVEPRHRDLAERIRAHVVRYGGVPSVQRRRWADAIAKMDRHHAKHGIEFAEIEAVWVWYAEHYTPDGKLPRLLNAYQFRERFDWIAAERNKALLRQPLSAAKLTEDARAVLAVLELRSWPSPAVDQLPAVVQRSLDAAATFIEQLRSIPTTHRLASVRDTLLSELGSPRFTVTKHLGERHTSLTRWTKWNGDLTRYVWSPEMIADIGRAILKRYAGHDRHWDELMAMIHAE